MHCYRGEMLCLIIRTLEAGAKLAIKEARGRPVFRRYEEPETGATVPPIAKTAEAAE